MISTSLFKAFKQRGVLAAAQSAQTKSFYNTPVRFFAKKDRDTAKAAATDSDAEPTPVKAEPVKAEPAP